MQDTQSALVVTVPEADPVVDRFRRRLDSGAALGVPAHVTILYPFMPPDQLTDRVLDQLRDLFRAVPPFVATFDSIGWFDRVAYLSPSPGERFLHLISIVRERWPDYLPYEGSVTDPVPHLTIGDNGDIPALQAAAREIETSLPIVSPVSDVVLFTGRLERSTWQPSASFPLTGPLE